MSVSHDVAAGEAGRLRLYALAPDTPRGAALRAAFAEDRPDIGTLVGDALGTGPLDAHWLTLVAVADIRYIGFATYLRAGHDVPDAQLSAAREALGAVDGQVLIVQSPAFDGRAATLRPAEGLTPLAEFDTLRAPAPARGALRASGPAEAPAAPPAAPRRPIPAAALLALLIVAGAAVAALALLGGR